MTELNPSYREVAWSSSEFVATMMNPTLGGVDLGMTSASRFTGTELCATPSEPSLLSFPIIPTWHNGFHAI
jgi:hypothetical protein